MQFGSWGSGFDYSRVKLDSTTLTSTSKLIHPTPTPFQQKVDTKSKQHTILILYCSMLIRSPGLPRMIIHPELVDNSISFVFESCALRVQKQSLHAVHVPTKLHNSGLLTTKVLNTTEICRIYFVHLWADDHILEHAIQPTILIGIGKLLDIGLWLLLHMITMCTDVTQIYMYMFTHMKLCAWVSKTNCVIHWNTRNTTQPHEPSINHTTLFLFVTQTHTYTYTTHTFTQTQHIQ